MAQRLVGEFMSRGQKCAIVDQDSYWVKDMPRVDYAGRSVKLYDHVDAVNWNAMFLAISEALQENVHVILTAFLLPVDQCTRLPKKVHTQFIEFVISTEISMARRKKSKAALCEKRGKEFDSVFDAWMVENYTTPLYESWTGDFYEGYMPTMVGAEFPPDTVYSTLKIVLGMKS